MPTLLHTALDNFTPKKTPFFIKNCTFYFSYVQILVKYFMFLVASSLLFRNFAAEIRGLSACKVTFIMFLGSRNQRIVGLQSYIYYVSGHPKSEVIVTQTYNRHQPQERKKETIKIKKFSLTHKKDLDYV